MSEKKSEFCLMIGGPVNGQRYPVNEKAELVRMFGELDEVVALYRRTRLSVVDHDTMLPVFKCVCK